MVTTSYRKDIDGLRAVAVMPVLLYHFGIDQISGGFAGVDVFFVISGYLIAGSILSDLNHNRFSLSNFYWRRFRRIMPALAAVVFASTIAAYFLMPSEEFVAYAWSVFSSMTFWSNIYFWDSIGYFSVSAELTPLLHTWSLSVEEQYYIFAPIAMFLIFRFLGARWIWVLLPLILLSFAASVYGLQQAPRFTFYWLPMRTWELLLGAFLMLRPLPRFSVRWKIECLGLAGLACLTFGYFTLTTLSAFLGTGALLPCFGAALLIYTGEHREVHFRPIATRLLEITPVVWVGLISYSLYLVHWPLISFATHALLLPIHAPIVLTTLSIVLATLMWKFVEQPFRNAPYLKTKSFIFAFTSIAIALNSLVAFAIISNQGFKGRSVDYTRVDVETVSWRNGTCFLHGGQAIEGFSADACIHDLGFLDAKVLLWGDSYAAQYVAGLEANSAAIGSNVVQITYAGCPPIAGFQSFGVPQCTAFNEFALGLATSGQFDTVLISALWDNLRIDQLAPMSKTLEALRGAGVSVIVIGQSPRYMADVQRIGSQARSRGEDPTQAITETAAAVRDLLKIMTANAGQTFVDPIELLCNAGSCPIKDEVDYFMFDEGHMGKRGASIALRRYFDSLLPEGQSLVRAN